MTPPTAEGGALRSQSVRRAATEPVVLNGDDPPGRPGDRRGAARQPARRPDATPNARRIVGFGFRNPFRFTVRPGHERALDRRRRLRHLGGDRPDPGPEGRDRRELRLAVLRGRRRQQPATQAPDLDPVLDRCTRHPTGLLSPYFTYNHCVDRRPRRDLPDRQRLVDLGHRLLPRRDLPGRRTTTRCSSPTTRRNCIWAMTAGLERPARSRRTIADLRGRRGRTRSTSRSDRAATSSTSTSTAGRSTGSPTRPANHPPTAVATATPTSGAVAADRPASTAARRTDPDAGDTLTYSWDLDGDGTFGDATAVRPPSYTYTTAGLVQPPAPGDRQPRRERHDRRSRSTSTTPSRVPVDRHAGRVARPGRSATRSPSRGHATDSTGRDAPGVRR